MLKHSLNIELNAVIVAIADNEPQILVDPQNALPSRPFATEHRTLEQGLRSWAGLPLGYVEQLYTFADKDRRKDGERVVSIGYLALMRSALPPRGSLWSSWYRHFPWEDHRNGFPSIIAKYILPALNVWAKTQRVQASRIAFAFPDNRKHWNEELVL